MFGAGMLARIALRDRADPIGRDDVVRKRRPARAVGVAGQRIVDLRRGGGEIAVAHRQRGHHAAKDVAGVVNRALVVAEEEQLVAEDRPAEREPALRELLRRRQVREVAARIRLLVVPEGEDAALQIVGAGLQRDVGDGSARSAELRVVVAGGDADRLDRLRRRDEHRQQPRPVIVVEPFNLDVVGQPRLPVDLRRQAVLRVEELRVRAERAGRAGHGHEDALEVPVEGQRHLLQLLAFDDAAGIGAVGLQRRYLRR